MPVPDSRVRCAVVRVQGVRRPHTKPFLVSLDPNSLKKKRAMLKSAKYAILRTHGGLGNQLFQVLFGRLFAEQHGLVLRELHDHRYRHAFSRSTEIARSAAPSAWQKLISSLRIPKVMTRLVGRSEAPWRLGRSIYLDGYFQIAEDYGSFPEDVIRRHLRVLAGELAIEPADLQICLVHLRTGDFFSDRAAAKAHVIQRLATAPAGSHVMTNDEALLNEPEVAEVMEARGVKMITTQGFSAEQVLRTMARYQRIDANDSKLTFWSSVLANCNVQLRHPRLRACRDLLARYGSGL